MMQVEGKVKNSQEKLSRKDNTIHELKVSPTVQAYVFGYCASVCYLKIGFAFSRTQCKHCRPS